MNTIRMLTFVAQEGLQAELSEQAFSELLDKLLTEGKASAINAIKGTALLIYDRENKLSTIIVVPIDNLGELN